jgi:hypothetical protein
VPLKSRRLSERYLVVVAALLCGGCYRVHSRGASGSRATDAGRGAKAPDSATVIPATDASCARFEQVTETVSKVDLLFVVDNSSSMHEEQAALRLAFPKLINALITGDRDGDGKQDFPAVADLHLGVVSSDLGLPGVMGIQNCHGLGDDGLLRHAPSPEVAGCRASYPSFLAFSAESGDPRQTAMDFACIAALGTGGCGFEQPLEAALKALWPANDDRISFLAEPVIGAGKLGHGDTDNAGFLRGDAQAGPSLLGVVVLTDEDDCSISDTQPFTPPQFLDPSDPLIKQGMNVRCHFHPQSLYATERYVNGLRALRPGNEDLVVFAAITGVPPDLVSADALAHIDLADAKQRDQFYKDLLNDTRMQETIDDRGTADPLDDALAHSCMSASGTADPPIRIVQVVRGFGRNGVLQSICQQDFTPALDAIVQKLGSRLATRCSRTP